MEAIPSASLRLVDDALGLGPESRDLYQRFKDCLRECINSDMSPSDRRISGTPWPNRQGRLLPACTTAGINCISVVHVQGLVRRPRPFDYPDRSAEFRVIFRFAVNAVSAVP